MSGARRGRERAGTAAVALLLAALAAGLLRLHDGDWWTAPPLPWQWRVAGLSVALYLMACAALGLRGRRLRRGAAPRSAVLVAWASQTGFARELAERSATALAAAGQPAQVLPLERVDAARLAASSQALFVVSTTGEGDAPDHAQRFVHTTLAQAPALAGLRYAVLALGDRGYGHFCAFGQRLDRWLQQCGARALADRIEVDNADPGALGEWQRLLAGLGGVAAPGRDGIQPRYERWRLHERVLLDAGSAGGAVYRLRLQPADAPLPAWQAGDIAEVVPCHAPASVRAWLQAQGLDGEAVVGDRTLRDALSASRLPETVPADATPAALVDALVPLPHREYSIASLPAEHHLALLVRRQVGADGVPGLGSGWLCEHAQPGDPIALRIRSNPGFHPPPAQRPMILIGNGTGIAGLRAQLAARVAAGARRHWLIFGERNAAHDRLYADELDAWQRAGVLERLDLAFSREAGARHRYVQHVLRDAHDALRAWVHDGAAIYVCGSLRGMTPAVDQALSEALGAELTRSLQSQGRYRRDVY